MRHAARDAAISRYPVLGISSTLLTIAHRFSASISPITAHVNIRSYIEVTVRMKIELLCFQSLHNDYHYLVNTRGTCMKRALRGWKVTFSH